MFGHFLVFGRVTDQAKGLFNFSFTLNERVVIKTLILVLNICLDSLRCVFG